MGVAVAGNLSIVENDRPIVLCKDDIKALSSFDYTCLDLDIKKGFLDES